MGAEPLFSPASWLLLEKAYAGLCGSQRAAFRLAGDAGNANFLIHRSVAWLCWRFVADGRGQ